MVFWPMGISGRIEAKQSDSRVLALIQRSKKAIFPPLSGSPLPGTSSKIEGLFLRCLFYSIGLCVNMAVTHSFDYCSFVMF